MRIRGAEELGIRLTSEQNGQFIIFLKELTEWSRNFNLTSITSEDDIITKHFLDSLSIVKALDLSGIKTLLDIGAGAGFPGIPIKIAFPHLEVTLVDSVRKKVAFMEHVIDTLELKGTEAVFCRSEDLPHEMRGAFDVVTSRAVADMRVLSEYCLPYVKMNGYFVAYKAKDIEAELEASKRAIKTLGGKIENTVELLLPGTDIKRTLIVIRKVERTPSAFPRRAGLAKTKPIF